MKFRFPLHIHLSTLFIVMTALIGGAIAAIAYYMSHQMLVASATDLTNRASREVISDIRNLILPAQTTVDIFSDGPLASARTLEERLRRVRSMSMPLSTSGLSGLYVGYENGDFFMLQNVMNEEQRTRLNAPKDTRFIVRSIERAAGKALLIYLNEKLETLGRDDKPGYLKAYDPRLREWYIQAKNSSETVHTDPYVFHSLRQVGVTVARQSTNGGSVFGADITLESIGEALKRQKVTPGSHLAIARADGMVTAHEELGQRLAAQNPDQKLELSHIDVYGIAPLKGMAAQIQEATTQDKMMWTVSQPDGDWRITLMPLYLKGAKPLYLMSAIPERELLAVAMKIRETSLLGTLLILLISIPVIWFTARTISSSIRQLATEAEAIRHFDFSTPVDVESSIVEVNALAETMELMKKAILQFMTISRAVAGEEDFDALLSMLLNYIILMSQAKSGALYLLEEDTLIPCIAYAGQQEVSGSLMSMPLNALPPLLNDAIHKQEAISRRMSPEELQQYELGDLSDARHVEYMVAIPLMNRRHQLLGLIKLHRDTPIDSAQLAFASTVADSASSSLEARGLIRDQKALFEAFIQLIAGAIDTKSPYTGGHCARVPVLTKMLVQAACDARTGPYADFKLTEEEWEAVHIAAWLHDCGKVTTPEYVVDKATKLETIYDRIHEVRMRFEVLKRDAEITCLKSIAAGQPETEARAGLAQQHKQLDEDFAFIAECNLGGEFMAPEKVERLKSIAARTWLRTLDDSLGISHEEARRREGQAAPTLPVTETLLADKPEHRIERTAAEKLPPDNTWGFNMKVPELLYNRGEMHNLAVARGTLSEEERYKINEHIVQTIIMLSALPFPRHLKKVAELAGGHHEKMDGTGYPKGLKKDEMSPVARMMAIADIFEALTATDRPYKKGKTLSEAIRIMGFMKKDQHIDPEQFELFLRSGVYLEYARQFMQPEMIDEVDIEAALRG